MSCFTCQATVFDFVSFFPVPPFPPSSSCGFDIVFFWQKISTFICAFTAAREYGVNLFFWTLSTTFAVPCNTKKCMLFHKWLKNPEFACIFLHLLVVCMRRRLQQKRAATLSFSVRTGSQMSRLTVAHYKVCKNMFKNGTPFPLSPYCCWKLIGVRLVLALKYSQVCWVSHGLHGTVAWLWIQSKGQETIRFSFLTT